MEISVYLLFFLAAVFFISTQTVRIDLAFSASSERPWQYILKLHLLFDLISFPLVKDRSRQPAGGPLRAERPRRGNVTSLSVLLALWPSLKFLRRKVRIERLEWISRIAGKNPAAVGLGSGLAWMVKGSVIAFLARWFRFGDRPLLSVQAAGKGENVSQISCILRIRLVHLITVLFILLLTWIRRRPKKASREDFQWTKDTQFRV